MKKQFHLVIILLLSLPLCAMAEEDEPFMEVFVPDLEDGVRIALGAYYADSTVNFDYVGVQNGTHIEALPFDTSFSWGFLGEVGYVFPDSGLDVWVTYNFLDSSDTSHTTGNVVVLKSSLDENAPAESATGDLSIDYDLAELMMGQTIQIGERNHLKFLFGLSYAQINMDTFVRYEGLQNNPDQMLRITDSDKFSGIGPRVGIADRYRFIPNFGLIIEGSFAVYFGENDLRHTELVAVDGRVRQNEIITSDPNNVTVPNLRGKIGLEYVQAFENIDATEFGVEAGYLADHYNDVLAVGDQAKSVSFTGPYARVFVAL